MMTSVGQLEQVYKDVGSHYERMSRCFSKLCLKVGYVGVLTGVGSWLQHSGVSFKTKIA